jgi:hypothetical protein
MIAAPVYVTTITQWAIRPTGPRGNMSKWVSDLRGDCPKRNAAQPVGRSSFISS